MKYLFYTSIALILALSGAERAYAADIFYIPQGVMLVNSFGSPPQFAGATSTALKSLAPGTTVYIGFCVTVNAAAASPSMQAGVATSSGFVGTPIISSPNTTNLNPGSAQYCDATTTTSQAITAGQDYFPSFVFSGASGLTTVTLGSAGDYFLVSDTPVIPPDNTTHIIVTIPPNNSTIATSTNAAVGANININTAEWVAALANNNGNWFLQVSVQRNTPITRQLDGPFDFLFKSILGTNRPVQKYTIPIPTSGFLSLSTTTDVSLPGSYYLTVQIIKPAPFGTILSFLGFGSATILDATSTTFVSSVTTSWDRLGASTSEAMNNFVASTTDDLMDKCFSWSGIQIADCLNLIFLPQSGDLGRVMNDLNTGLFTYAPWGYVTRIVNIFSGNATSSFPLISTGIPDPSNPHHLLAFHFDPNEAILGAAGLMDSIRDPVTDENPRDALETIVKTIIALAVVSIIFYDLSGGRSRGRGAGIKTKLS